MSDTTSHDSDVSFIRALAELLNQNDLTELQVKREYGEDDSLNVRVSRMQPQAAPAAAPAPAETQGVTDDAIVIGVISDLSGPLASGGVPNVQGLRMRIEEANAPGGVHGRMIDLRVEDMKYDLTLAVRATNKLVKRDRIFAMISSVGTPSTSRSVSAAACSRARAEICE